MTTHDLAIIFPFLIFFFFGEHHFFITYITNQNKGRFFNYYFRVITAVLAERIHTIISVNSFVHLQLPDFDRTNTFYFHYGLNL